jgi:prepilin-type N-terminal cleavage/methylation domain-containing protein
MRKRGAYMSKAKVRAFTLVELLVVIAIIALLLAILMPALNKVKEQAKFTLCAANVHQIGIAEIAYTGSYNGKFTPGDQCSGNGIFYFDPVTVPGGLGLVNVGHLLPSYLPVPTSSKHAFYCPGADIRKTPFLYKQPELADPTWYRDFWHTWGKTTGSGMIGIAYEFRDSYDGLGGPQRYTRNDGAQVPVNIPIFSDGITFALDFHINKWNVLFTDGAVRVLDGRSSLGRLYWNYVKYYVSTRGAIDDSASYRMLDDYFGVKRWKIPSDGSVMSGAYIGKETDPPLSEWKMKTLPR